MNALPRRFNDTLAVLLAVGIPAVVLFAQPSEYVAGVLLAGWTLIIQFYFRKAPEGTNPQNGRTA